MKLQFDNTWTHVCWYSFVYYRKWEYVSLKKLYFCKEFQICIWKSNLVSIFLKFWSWIICFSKSMCKRAYKHKLCIFAEIAKFEQCTLSHIFILLSKWQFSIRSKKAIPKCVTCSTSFICLKTPSLEILHSLICIPILIVDLQLIKWCNASSACKRESVLITGSVTVSCDWERIR